MLLNTVHQLRIYGHSVLVKKGLTGFVQPFSAYSNAAEQNARQVAHGL